MKRLLLMPLLALASAAAAQLAPSGKDPVTISVSSAAASSSFGPLAGRPFNILITGCTASAALERSLDGGTTYNPVTVLGTAVTFSITTTLGANESWTETEAGARYRVNFSGSGSYSSGTCAGRFSQ